MCIKPKPYIYSCPNCNWNKKISPKSDVLSPNEIYFECPVCGFKNLDKKESYAFFVEALRKIF